MALHNFCDLIFLVTLGDCCHLAGLVLVVTMKKNLVIVGVSDIWLL
jgi:hypothetical protein